MSEHIVRNAAQNLTRIKQFMLESDSMSEKALATLSRLVKQSFDKLLEGTKEMTQNPRYQSNPRYQDAIAILREFKSIKVTLDNLAQLKKLEVPTHKVAPKLPKGFEGLEDSEFDIRRYSIAKGREQINDSPFRVEIDTLMRTYKAVQRRALRAQNRLKKTPHSKPAQAQFNKIQREILNLDTRINNLLNQTREINDKDATFILERLQNANFQLATPKEPKVENEQQAQQEKQVQQTFSSKPGSP